MSYERANNCPLYFPDVIAFLALGLMEVKSLRLSDMIQKVYLDFRRQRPDRG